MVGAHGSKQCGLWQKESHRANALYVDCFADLDANHKKSVDNILHDALNSQPKKSDIASEQFQRLGAREFRKRKWNEAIELYNRALCMAENGSFNLQLSYEGRSNCLAKRDMTEVASIDMDFVASRPAKRRSERIQNRKLSSTTRTMRTFVPNRKFPSLASALEVRQNSKFGRHIVSNRDIGVGNTIAIERQFASVICSDESKEQQAYCLTCFRTDAHFIPCPNCVDVMYCSRTCQQNNDIHQLECQSLFHRLNSSKAKLAVQMVLIAVKHFPNVDALMAFVEGIINDSSNNLNELANDAFPSYGVLLKLQCCPTKNDKIRAFDAFKLMMTTMPTIQHYFASKSSQRFLQHLLIHHLGIVRSNGFYDTSGWTNNLECKYIHDTISLLNHSCAPNAFYMLHNNVGTLLTVRPIKKGDQVFINYLGDEVEKPRWKRRRLLEKHWQFQCQCDECSPMVSRTEQLANERLMFSDTDFKYYRNHRQDAYLPIDHERRIYLKQMCAQVLTKYGHIWSSELNDVVTFFVSDVLHQ